MNKVKLFDILLTFSLDDNGVIKIIDIVTQESREDIAKLICTKDYYSRYELDKNGIYYMMLNVKKGLIFNKIKGLKPKGIFSIN